MLESVRRAQALDSVAVAKIDEARISVINSIVEVSRSKVAARDLGVGSGIVALGAPACG